MNYGDGTAVELYDTVEVLDAEFEPEEAHVIKLGKKKIKIEWDNPHIKPAKTFVSPESCELLFRVG